MELHALHSHGAMPIEHHAQMPGTQQAATSYQGCTFRATRLPFDGCRAQCKVLNVLASLGTNSWQGGTAAPPSATPAAESKAALTTTVTEALPEAPCR
jgi:hypothetical protein